MLKTLIFAIAVISSISVMAQPVNCLSDRYQKKVFNNIKVTKDITFGAAPNVFGINQSLELDFFEPASTEEYLQKRPLVVLFFGGSFVAGNKNDKSIQTWCDSLAHYGYACAAVEYRLDNIFNFALPNQGVRAAYRAIQDGRAAIRFLLEDPNGFGFNVDENYIYTAGESAGAITAIHIAYLDDGEQPTETLSPNMGCLDCSGNSFVQPFSVAGIIDLWGATLDLNYIDKAEDVPMVIIHGSNDNVVPYTSGSPFNISLLPTVYGAVPMDNEMTIKDICHQFFPYPGAGHTIYGNGTNFPNQYWQPIFTQATEFVYDKTMQFLSPIPAGKLLVCEDGLENYQVTANAGSLFCWEVINGTIVATNNNMVSVQWNNTTGYLSLTETNAIDVVGETQTIEITPYTLTLSTAITNAGSSLNNNGAIDVSISGGVAPYSYNWSTGNTTEDVNNLAPGVYALTITDSNGCNISETGIVVGNNCPDSLVQSNNPDLLSGTEQVADFIRSNGSVLSGNQVNFKAGNLIRLQQGFRVDAAAEFSAHIESCP